MYLVLPEKPCAVSTLDSFVEISLYSAEGGRGGNSWGWLSRSTNPHWNVMGRRCLNPSKSLGWCLRGPQGYHPPRMRWCGHNCGSLAPLQRQWGRGHMEVGWPRERQGIGFMRLLWAQSVLWGVGKGCLPSLRLKGGLEGRGRNPQPSVPWPRAERWCLPPSLLPPFSHIKARLFALDVSKAGPATCCSQIPSLRGQITPACTSPCGVGFSRRPGKWKRPGLAPSARPTERLLHPSHGPGRHRSISLWGMVVAVKKQLFLALLQAVSSLGWWPEALGAVVAPTCHGFTGHTSHAAPSRASLGGERQEGTPDCPTEQLGAGGMTWKFKRKVRGKREDWIDPFFPLPFTCLQIFIRLSSCRAKRFFIVPSKACCQIQAAVGAAAVTHPPRPAHPWSGSSLAGVPGSSCISLAGRLQCSLRPLGSQRCAHFVGAFARFRKSSLPKCARPWQNPGTLPWWTRC